MSRYQESRDEVNEDYWRSEHRQRSEDTDERPWIEQFLELGREMQELHREITNKEPF